MVDAKKWRELHMTQASRLEYGVWFPAAMATLEKQKQEVKNRSFQLGISLHFVFTELEATAFQDFRAAKSLVGLQLLASIFDRMICSFFLQCFRCCR